MSRMTDAFRAAWTAFGSRRPVALAQIELPGLTLHVATDAIRIDGQQYDPILGTGSIANSGKFVGNSLALATCDVTLIDKLTSTGYTVSQLLAAYDWIGSTITIWYTDRALTTLDDALQKFTGTISTYSVKTNTVALQCSQSKRFNKTITPATVTRANSPQAPDAAIGAHVGTFYGSLRGLPMRYPHPDRYGDASYAREKMSGGRLVFKSILVDTGRGGGSTTNPPAKVLVSGHKLSTLGWNIATATGTGVFVRGQDGKAHAIELAVGDAFNDTTGAGFYLRDQSLTFGSVSTTNNSTTITRSAGWTGAAVGMRVAKAGLQTVSGSQLPWDAWVTAISGTSLTLSRKCSGSATGVTVVFEPYTVHAPVPTATTAAAGYFGDESNPATGSSVPITDFNISTLQDSDNETPYAMLNTGGTAAAPAWQGAMGLFFGDTTEAGTLQDLEFFATYRTSSALGDTWMFVSETITPGLMLAQHRVIWAKQLTPSTTPTTVRVSFVGDIIPEHGWSGHPFSDGDGSTPVLGWDTSRFEISFVQMPYASRDSEGNLNGSPSSYGYVQVFTAGASARYIPSELDVASGKTLVPVIVPRPSSNSGLDASPLTTYTEKAIDTNVSDQIGDYFANLEGWSDSDGSYTGTTNALIQRPPDVVRHILGHYGAVDSGDFVTDTGAMGSFVDARALMTTWAGTDMVLGFGFTTPSSISTLLSWIMTASASDIWRGTSDGAWRFLPWTLAPAVTYGRGLKRLDVMDPETGVTVTMTPDSDVLSGVTINYGYDENSGSYQHTVSATSTGTVAGKEYHAMRDGGPFITITDTNNAIQVQSTFGGSVTTLTLSAATHTRESLTAAVHSGFGSGWSVGFGGVIVESHNDRIYFKHTGDDTPYTVTLPAGTYTMEQLAAAAQAAINEVLDGYSIQHVSVTYSRATRKFTYSRASAPFSLNWATSPTRSAAAMFGFGGINTTSATSVTSQGEIEEDRFAISITSPYYILWRSGTHGLLGDRTCAWELLGYDWQTDSGYTPTLNPSTGSLQTGFYHLADCPRRAREADLVAGDDQTGEKAPVQVDGRCLYDTRTALETRNRLIGLLGAPRGTVAFASETVPDLERGDTFQFTADLDSLRAYAVPGTDGSWAGKTFRVIEDRSSFGDAWHSEIVAVDLTE